MEGIYKAFSGVLLLAAAAACADANSPPQPTVALTAASEIPGRRGYIRISSPADDAVMLNGWSGATVNAGNARQSMRRLAKAMALAMQDPNFRAMVYSAVHTSTVREHKVHLSSLLDRTTDELLLPLARATGRDLGHLKSLWDSTIALELYLPVPAHFELWDGGTDVLVGTALFDHEMPLLFDLEGNEVPVLSPDDPPTRPVIAIVPLEGNWGPNQRHRPMFAKCDPEVSECGGGDGGGGGSPPPPPAGVAMTFAYIDDDYEGFLMGGPEFEVHTFWPPSSQNPTLLRNGQCSGSEAANPNRSGPGIRSSHYEYDHENLSWTGDVLLVSGSQLAAASANGEGLVYMVWEDDNTPCAIRRSDQAIHDYQYDVSQGLANGRQGFKNGATFTDPIAFALHLAGQVLGENLVTHSDDFVGVMVNEAEALQNYPDANMVIRADGFNVGRANLIRR